MKEQILRKLKEFETNNKVEVLLAVESGSRGWGFASVDSDYDVRFVYKYPTEMYLGLQKPQDCYAWTDGELDFEGFDIYKFFDLLLKSNMNIIDWLFQTGENVYVDKLKNKSGLQKCVLDYFNHQTYISHNYGLCAKNFKQYFENPKAGEPNVKRYIYCIRAIASARYCSHYKTIAPLDFNKLIKKIFAQEDIADIDEMILIKNQSEHGEYQNEKWVDYIQSSLTQSHPKAEENDPKTYEVLLNQILQGELKEVKT